MSHVEKHTGTSQVQWGKVLSGAAIATGAVLMGVAVADNSILGPAVATMGEIANNVLSGLGNGIQAIFSAKPEAVDTGVFAAIGTMFKNLGSFIANNSAALGGSTLLGGGLAYMAAHYESQPQASMAPAMATSDARVQNAQMGFAAREQMRAVNALMQARMQAFGQAPDQGAER